jgi:hypothetical protein
MSGYTESIQVAWGNIKNILLEMSGLYTKIKKDPNDQGLQKQYALRIGKLDMHTQSFFNAMRTMSDSEQADYFVEILNGDLNGTFYQDMGEGQLLCRDVVEKIFSVANFHVLQMDGDKELWKSVKVKYEEFLKTIPSS